MTIPWHDGPCCANWALKWSHMVWQKPNYKLPSQEIDPSASLMLNFSQWLLTKRTIQTVLSNILKYYKYFSKIISYVCVQGFYVYFSLYYQTYLCIFCQSLCASHMHKNSPWVAFDGDIMTLIMWHSVCVCVCVCVCVFYMNRSS